MFYKSPVRALQDLRDINTGHYGKKWSIMKNNGTNGCQILTRLLEFCFFRFWLKDRLLFLNRQLSENLDSNAICLYRRIWFGILHKIRNLPVVTKCFSWKEPPSLNVKSSIDKYTQKQLKCLPYKLMLVKF